MIAITTPVVAQQIAIYKLTNNDPLGKYGSLTKLPPIGGSLGNENVNTIPIIVIVIAIVIVIMTTYHGHRSLRELDDYINNNDTVHINNNGYYNFNIFFVILL
jgi:hypothetical protein